MSNYKRFITYLFQYEKNEKKLNCGFAKVEQRQNQCRMEFHIKNCPGQINEIQVCLFVRKEGYLPQISIGKLPVKNHSADGVFRFDGAAVGGTMYQFSQIRGIIIPLQDDFLIASQWDDEKTDWNRLRPEKKENVEETKERPQITAAQAEEPDNIRVFPGQNTQEETTEVQNDKKVISNVERLMEQEILKSEQKDEKEIKAEEHDSLEQKVIPIEQSGSEQEGMGDDADLIMEEQIEKEESITGEEELKIQSAGAAAVKNAGMENCWNALKKTHREIYPFSGDTDVRAIRFDIKDFKQLPKQYWFMRNNSFLLHGYFNYGALLLGYIQSENRWFLGVPGVFQNQERVMASIFSFTEFRTQEQCIQKTGEFGYWYRYLN
ncbi:Uncharacterised protein [uncultured Roseburia sp.]|uniref:DUF6128 domain-containing protein n=1 Tax=Brotonthovivens ammoniilytica TaxID=2981725 RepID=A0ABT2TQK9_9FIRM|nr:DUF6128 domain-containing protein [Brotonthovivens ammoniilytica]MCU6763754.1 DUF6128 domain-containing protein [Brotonthovivens ammoniilytica]SCJ33809.1 Uncharacterised protein [uncultured Roseburia sp.]